MVVGSALNVSKQFFGGLVPQTDESLDHLPLDSKRGVSVQFPRDSSEMQASDHYQRDTVETALSCPRFDLVEIHNGMRASCAKILLLRV